MTPLRAEAHIKKQQLTAQLSFTLVGKSVNQVELF